MSSQSCIGLSHLFSQLNTIRNEIIPYTQAVEQCSQELVSLLTQPELPVHHINERIAAIFKVTLLLKKQANVQLGFVPEKLNSFCNQYAPFFENWKWMMCDEHFQDPFHRLYSQVQKLCSKSDLTRADCRQLQCCISELFEPEKRAVLGYLGSPFFSHGSDPSSSDDSLSGKEISWIIEGQLHVISPATLKFLMGRLQLELLPARVARLSTGEIDLLKRTVEMKARDEGVIIEDWDLDWQDHHLFDCPSRLVSALFEVSLMRHNETLFRLWTDLKQLGTSYIAFQLVTQCPLLQGVRNANMFEVDHQVIDELRSRAAFLNRLYTLQMRLSLNYPCLRWIMEDPSHPISKGMHEKLMQVILSPSPLFGSSAPNKLISSLEAYYTIIHELITSGEMTGVDAMHLLEVANRQYALHPTQTVAQNEEALMQLLGQAKSVLRSSQLTPESGIVRIKPEQYQSIFLFRSEDGTTLGKFKPLPPDSVQKEMLGEELNAVLGTDFSPAATSVWLSIRNELLSIRSLLESDKHKEAMEQFNLLGERLRHEIYYQIFELKMPIDPPDSYGELAWHGHPDLAVTKEERMEAINRYLNPKRPLEIIRGCFESGDISQAMKRFQLLNFDLKHFIYYELFLIKNPINPPGEYGEWAWNGHSDFPVSNEERIAAIERCLASPSFDQFVLSRDPMRFHFQGTLQTWAKGCVEATDFIYNNPLAGQMLRNLPVSLVQMYNILGIIKGSGDCHSGNTLLQFNKEGRIINLIDCDDEFIMPDVNHVDQIQIWTLGFPQASQPLLKPIIMMLASPEFTEKWIKFVQSKTRNQMDPKIQAFEFRIWRLSQLCREEMSKPVISLTCQDLYFELYGGREKFEQLKRAESNRPEFILFQYFMKDGMIQYLNEDAMNGEIFRCNAKDLYS